MIYDNFLVASLIFQGYPGNRKLNLSGVFCDPSDSLRKFPPATYSVLFCSVPYSLSAVNTGKWTIWLLWSPSAPPWLPCRHRQRQPSAVATFRICCVTARWFSGKLIVFWNEVPVTNWAPCWNVSSSYNVAQFLPRLPNLFKPSGIYINQQVYNMNVSLWNPSTCWGDWPYIHVHCYNLCSSDRASWLTSYKTTN